MKKQEKKIIGFSLLTSVVVFAVFAGYELLQNERVLNILDKIQKQLEFYIEKPSTIGMNSSQLTELHYGQEIDEIAIKYGLPANYLKALVVLECSGNKPVEPRFENHIFKKLKNVREKKGRYYEKVTHEILHDASDAALKNLAKSWGPFQLMGYKCLQLNVLVNDIRGDDALDWGAKWIKMEYGHLLEQKRYKDAFHYHNTGRIFPADGIPTTHDPKYIEKGLDYMSHFSK